MNKSSSISAALRITAFLRALLIMLNQVYKILCFKYGDGILGLKKLYEFDDDSIDVLALGSSHAFEDINTGVLFRSYGIAAYILAGSVQPYWNTYYYLAEALKTQTPRLVILEAYASTFDFDYSDHSRIIKNNLGLRSPEILYSSLKISSPQETFDNYWFSYRLWHSRYSELGEWDFEAYYQVPLYQYYMGFGINFATTAFEVPELSDCTDALQLTNKTETYYRKIIELCINRDIPLLIVASPYVVNDREQKLFHQSELIADEYGVNFINFNSAEYYNMMELDFNTDFADRDHLNYIGNIKYTYLLGKFLREQYLLPDRRGESAYKIWELHSNDVLNRTYNQFLKEESNFNAYLEKLENNKSNYTIAVMAVNCPDSISQYADELSGIGIEIGDFGNGSLHILKSGKLDYQSHEISWIFNDKIGNNMIHIQQDAEFTHNSFSQTHELLWNGINYVKNTNGIYILVYDNLSETLVDICCFSESADGRMAKENL